MGNSNFRINSHTRKNCHELKLVASRLLFGANNRGAGAPRSLLFVAKLQRLKMYFSKYFGLCVRSKKKARVHPGFFCAKLI